MTVAPDANDVLMGGGSQPTAKFETPGTTVGGKIVAPPRSHQEREYNPNSPGQGTPKTYPSGDPIFGLSVDVQTQLRDASIENDTGVRRIYIEGKRMKEAVREAVRQAGADKLLIGGELHVTFTGLGQAASAAVNPPKEYTARYVPPAQAAVGIGQQQPAPVQQQPQQQTVQQAPLPQQQAPAPVPAPQSPAGPTPEQVVAVRNAGLDPAVIFAGQQLPAGV